MVRPPDSLPSNPLSPLPELIPAGIVIFVELPVPPLLGAEASLPLPHPVLKPECSEGCAEGFELVVYIEDLIRAALQADDRAAEYPLWQQAHPARVLCVELN